VFIILLVYFCKKKKEFDLEYEELQRKNKENKRQVVRFHKRKSGDRSYEDLNIVSQDSSLKY